VIFRARPVGAQSPSICWSPFSKTSWLYVDVAADTRGGIQGIGSKMGWPVQILVSRRCGQTQTAVRSTSIPRILRAEYRLGWSELQSRRSLDRAVRRVEAEDASEREVQVPIPKMNRRDLTPNRRDLRPPQTGRIALEIGELGTWRSITYM
jgi:hypothetical protein